MATQIINGRIYKWVDPATGQETPAGVGNPIDMGPAPSAPTPQPQPTPPSYNPQPTPPQQPSAPQWNLSSWTGGGGTWTNQPVLTINGQQFRFNSPQEYIDKMNQAGINDGQSSLFKQQFQNIVSGWSGQQEDSTQQFYWDPNTGQRRDYVGTVTNGKKWAKDNGLLDLPNIPLGVGQNFGNLKDVVTELKRLGISTSGIPEKYTGTTTQPNPPASTTGPTKLPSGIIVRDKSTQEMWFIDNGNKRKITSPSVLTPGAGYVDIDSSHLAGVPTGNAITSKPSFNFKTTEQVQTLLNGTGINWQQPSGYKPPVNQPTPPVENPVTPPNKNIPDTASLLTPTQFKYLQEQGITENDLIRDGDKIYIKNAVVGPFAEKLKSFNHLVPIEDLPEGLQDALKQIVENPVGKRQIYRIGNDIYDASTGKKISATDWANNWSGKPDVVEIDSPNQDATGKASLIPFRLGLTKEQKDEIIALSKKTDKWTAADIANWNWATNGATRPTQEETASEDKNIYKKGNDLYIKDASSGIFYKITNTDQLKKLVFEQGYDDTRLALPEGAKTSNVSIDEIPSATAGYDPFEKALELGYTRDDFANDPGFEAYWKNKTPEQLAAALAKRGDFDTTTGYKKGAPAPEAPEETPDLTDLFSSMINVDPFLAAQLEDPALRAQFDTLDPALKMQYLMNLRALKESIEAGQVVNPNLEITPEQTAAFEEQAKAKVAGYYDELIGNETGDLKTKLERMKEDYTTGVGRAEELFKENLQNQAESAAQAGLTFGSQRGEKVSKTIKAQQEGLSDAALEMARTQQDLATQAERRIGSSAFGNLGIDTSVQNYNVGEGGFTQAGTRNLFDAKGNIVGEIPKQREVDVINERNNLILAEKQKRILENSQLNGNPITDWTGLLNTPGAGKATTERLPITLPGGQVISPTDPNYDEYLKQYPQTSTASTTNTATQSTTTPAVRQIAIDNTGVTTPTPTPTPTQPIKTTTPSTPIETNVWSTGNNTGWTNPDGTTGKVSTPITPTPSTTVISDSDKKRGYVLPPFSGGMRTTVITTVKNPYTGESVSVHPNDVGKIQWINPTTGTVDNKNDMYKNQTSVPQQPAPQTPQPVANEEELQSIRVKLGQMGIPTSEWNKYISSPDANGKIFYTPPNLKPNYQPVKIPSVIMPIKPGGEIKPVTTPSPLHQIPTMEKLKTGEYITPPPPPSDYVTPKVNMPTTTDLTLPNGQKISSTDPNYEEYKKTYSI